MSAVPLELPDALRDTSPELTDADLAATSALTMAVVLRETFKSVDVGHGGAPEVGLDGCQNLSVERV